MNIKIENYSDVMYLGNSIYVGKDNIGRIWIFTYDGKTIRNEICLEDYVLGNLLEIARSSGYR